MHRNSIWRNAAGVGLALGAAALLGGYWYTQQQQVSDLQQQIDQLPNSKDKVALVKDRIALENTIAGSLIQSIGGLFIFVTAYVSFQNLKAIQKNVEVAQRNLKATEEKQVTERFTQAINQLGNEKSITTRYGGIYALERIAIDSPRDHWTIMEVLTTFVHEKSPAFDIDPDERVIPVIPQDVQAALIVIGRREEARDPEGAELNLSVNHLYGADLRKAKLNKASLSATYLRTADFTEADLSEARLIGSNLSEAIFEKASLEKAVLTGANLTKTNFSDAILRNADLSRANLTGANLGGANLAGANLSGANLSEAILNKADLSGVTLSNQTNLEFTHFEDATLRGAKIEFLSFTNALLFGADFSGAIIENVYFRNAQLDRANFTGAKLCKVVFTEGFLRETDFKDTYLWLVTFKNVEDLTPQQVKAAKNWEQADYDADFRQKLGLPPQSEEV